MFLCRVYDYRDHKKFRDGKWTEEQVFQEFLKNFDSPDDPDGKVGVVSGCGQWVWLELGSVKSTIISMYVYRPDGKLGVVSRCGQRVWLELG